MAPEVVACETLKDTPYDAKADIWSLGMMCSRCWSGKKTNSIVTAFINWEYNAFHEITIHYSVVS